MEVFGLTRSVRARSLVVSVLGIMLICVSTGCGAARGIAVYCGENDRGAPDPV